MVSGLGCQGLGCASRVQQLGLLGLSRILAFGFQGCSVEDLELTA